jgi:hypothetical protein
MEFDCPKRRLNKKARMVSVIKIRNRSKDGMLRILTDRGIAVELSGRGGMW